MNEYNRVNWVDGTILQPAKVTIDGTDYNITPAVESGTTPLNATNLNKMDAGIKQATLDLQTLNQRKIEHTVIELLEVTDTAPAECSEGDKYYNTSTEYIYTAIADDTWGTEGETPISTYLYADITNNKVYYYDGTTFASYGGGGETVPAEIAIQTTQPVEDEKLWINPEDIPSGTGFELNKFYPVGSIYINTTGVNPSTFMGGTWQSFGAGKVLVGQDTNDTDFDTLLETGGSKYLQAHRHRTGAQANYYGAGPAGSETCQVLVDTTNGQETSETGTGNSGNLQPYIVVSMWVRTA